MPIQNMYYMWRDRKGAEFIENKHIHSLTLKYTQLYVLVQISLQRVNWSRKQSQYGTSFKKLEINL